MAVTCRVLKLSRQPYYRWLANPVTDREVVEAYRANALFDAHRDDPEFGHRLLADEARDAGEAMADRTAWRICVGQWLVERVREEAGGKRQQARAAGPRRPRAGRERSPPIAAPNELWLTDITEHKTAEGKLYLCAIKDVFRDGSSATRSTRRMKSSLAVHALENAVARRGAVAGCVVHSDRGSQFRSRKFLRALTRHRLVGSMGRVGAAATTPPWKASSACCRRTSSTAAPGPPGSSYASRS